MSLCSRGTDAPAFEGIIPEFEGGVGPRRKDRAPPVGAGRRSRVAERLNARGGGGGGGLRRLPAPPEGPGGHGRGHKGRSTRSTGPPDRGRPSHSSPGSRRSTSDAADHGCRPPRLVRGDYHAAGVPHDRVAGLNRTSTRGEPGHPPLGGEGPGAVRLGLAESARAWSGRSGYTSTKPTAGLHPRDHRAPCSPP